VELTSSPSPLFTGNGLTHLLFMKPTTRSTVMEFFYPGGFACESRFDFSEQDFFDAF